MIAARSTQRRDPFEAARCRFEDLLSWAGGDETPMDESVFEEQLIERGTDVLRCVLQGRFDLLSSTELAEWTAAGSPSAEGETIRSRSRQVESKVGRVVLRRLGHKRARESVRFPLDALLNLPADLYTHPLRQRVAEGGARGAWDGVVERVDQATGGHVPKRQAEKLAIAAAQDFDAFYAEPMPANEVLGESALLVGSSDSKGVRMLPHALRAATRKAALAEAKDAVRGDPMATKKPRLHDKRMAVVTAVWEQTPLPRTATDIVTELRRTPRSTSPSKKKRELPRPHNKRVSASVESGIVVVVGKLFDEFDRRDSSRARRAIVVVDGEESQQSAILSQSVIRKRAITLVLDLIHVIHYLWMAGFALCRKDKKATDLWVAKHLLLLLSSPVDSLIAAIEAAARARRLGPVQRRPVDKALGYFRRNKSFMDYPAYLAHGLPIASGVIEGACRHLVQDRLGITGARWDLHGAEAVLRLRALHTSGDWDRYWRFHQQQERRRNYPTAA
jgi:hypothetical protein